MRKQLKMMVSLVLTMVLVVGLAMPSLAATVTLPGDDSAVAEHSFKAYQVFVGSQNDTSGAGLANVEWGTGIDAAEFLEELQALNVGKEPESITPFSTCKTAKEVADILSTYKDQNKQTNIDVMNKVSQCALDHIKGNGTVLTTGPNNLADGYYLIVDTTTVNDKVVINPALLQVTSDINITPKVDKPHIEKYIVDEGKDVAHNTAAIGDTVTYKITSKVPDMSHYTNYKFVVSDVLSKGLKLAEGLAESNLKITIGGKLVPMINYKVETIEITDDNWKTLNTNKPNPNLNEDDIGGTYIKITFVNFKENYQSQKGADIVIQYDAIVDTDAVIGSAGNSNDVKLNYSNDPNSVGVGNDFDSTEPEGETPEYKVSTFVTELLLKKVDKEGRGALTGAQFKITATEINQSWVTGFKFEEDVADTSFGPEDTVYYKLKDGTYTDIAPDTARIAKDQYALKNNAEGQYIKCKKVSFSTEVVAEKIDVNNKLIEVDQNGELKITGLKAGTYTIEEVKSPDGYNLLKDPIVLKIVIDKYEGSSGAGYTAVWKVEGDTAEDGIDVATDGKITLTVENGKGAELPETGGIGTTIFYVVGAILVVGAGIVLVTRRRMRAE